MYVRKSVRGKSWLHGNSRVLYVDNMPVCSQMYSTSLFEMTFEKCQWEKPGNQDTVGVIKTKIHWFVNRCSIFPTVQQKCPTALVVWPEMINDR